jgi:hypothetical protein
MKMAGYSQTPLAKKLGIKEEMVISILQAPHNYFKLFTDFPHKVEITEEVNRKKDLVHLFVFQQEELIRWLPLVKNQIVSNGIIWVSWPKKASCFATDLNEDVIRKVALENNLVDVKVCAVDDFWSGLKLVIPVALRKLNPPGT